MGKTDPRPWLIWLVSSGKRTLWSTYHTEDKRNRRLEQLREEYPDRHWEVSGPSAPRK